MLEAKGMVINFESNYASGDANFDRQLTPNFEL